MCKAIYDYDATDTDELTFKEGDIIEIIKEGVCEVERKQICMDLRCIEVMLQQYECHFVFILCFCLFCFQILLAGGKVD